MIIVPLSRDAAFAFVRALHRHNPIPPASHKFSLGLVDDAPWARKLVGVCVAGRPGARAFDVSLDDWLADDREPFTIELTRCCTDGTPNACTMLYGAARRSAVAQGYQRVVTYTQRDEGGRA